MPRSKKTKDKVTDMVDWPYPVNYGFEHDISADVLIIGGGVSGCFAAIQAVKKGAKKVVIVDKGVVVHSGSAGAGIDHWMCAPTNPCSKVTPEELTQAISDNFGGWDCAIGRYIECKESYDALLELEKMGMKIRDTEEEFKGSDFRDEKTKLLFAYDYVNRYCLRIWGTEMKPSLYRECRRLGVEMYERIMVTSLLTENGEQGGRVVGATGFSLRSGEFYNFGAKATVLTAGREGRLWLFSSEYRGLLQNRPPYITGDGIDIAWRAGAQFTLFEKSVSYRWGGHTSIDHPNYATGYWDATWRPCSLVDANGKPVPWVDRDGNILSSVAERNRPAPGQKFFLRGVGIAPTEYPIKNLSREYRAPVIIPDLDERIKNGEYVLPLYADLPSMPEHERKAIFGLMVGQEGRSWISYRNLVQGGFDRNRDMLQFYAPKLQPRWRGLSFNGGGLVYDWDLKTNLEGLFAAGEALFSLGGVSAASATGRYAGRKAAEYAQKAKRPVIERRQVDNEKTRVYTPIKRKTGIEWKELNAAICEVMQDYCSDLRNEESLKVGLRWLNELEQNESPTVCARNPHELARTLECSSILSVARIVMHASLERRASSEWINFFRSDYPQLDPPEWNKFITLKQEDGEIKTGELPFAFWGSLKDNYESHCGY